MERSGAEKKNLQPYFSNLLPSGGAREILSILRIVDAMPGGHAVHRAMLLRKLSDFGFKRIVVRYWNKNRRRIASQVEPWSETIRALTALKNYRGVRKLMAGWQQRKGVGMWVIANYVMALRGTSSRQLKALRSACQDALAGLPHDHCARYLVYRGAEASALLGDKEALLDCCQRYREYFDGKLEEGEWFEEKRRYLLTDLPALERFLKSNDLRNYKTQLRRLRREQFKLSLPSLETPKTNVRWWWIVWLLLWLLIQAIRISNQQP
jgi:hypothetical protein